MRRISHVFLTAFGWICLGLQLASCEALELLRANPNNPNVALHTTQNSLLPPDLAGLEIVIHPPLGITVLLDGNTVTHQSPLSQRDLSPNKHTLHIRGMGYLPVTLPLVLQAGTVLKLNISLRPRPELPHTTMPTMVVNNLAVDTTPQNAAAAASLEPNTPEPMPLSQPQSTKPQSNKLQANTTAKLRNKTALSPSASPVGVPINPVDMYFMVQPSKKVWVDKTLQKNKFIRFAYDHGTLNLGSIDIGYTITGARMLELQLPQKDAKWYQDGVEIKPNCVVSIGHNISRLERLDSQGARQSIVLRRIDPD